MGPSGIRAWQKRLGTCPAVWLVEDSDSSLSNVYESCEAAQIELDWRRARGQRGWRCRSEPICSLVLARQRFGKTTSVVKEEKKP